MGKSQGKASQGSSRGIRSPPAPGMGTEPPPKPQIPNPSGNSGWEFWAGTPPAPHHVRVDLDGADQAVDGLWKSGKSGNGAGTGGAQILGIGARNLRDRSSKIPGIGAPELRDRTPPNPRDQSPKSSGSSPEFLGMGPPKFPGSEPQNLRDAEPGIPGSDPPRSREFQGSEPQTLGI